MLGSLGEESSREGFKLRAYLVKTISSILK